ncbi:thiamine pyrophosphate-binding protein [Peredibacter sp. HCB2-198]|uniref:thiamine pyrophosphate-binding protein n=1 Tax=Peredibacter sp. HCB2-198 TaxID=3383025 RepID=UPI0038B5CBBF
MKMNLEKIFFCTGARNHDLLKIFDSSNVKFEYDERMASFKALGLTKVAKNPVGICTTSGTAVSQCVSAMLEAYYSENPLVLISGDRPKKLHGTGSPQTIDHEALTRSCRRSYVEIDVSELATFSLEGLEFPVHINVLVDDTAPHTMELINHESISGFASFLNRVKKPLFVFSHENKSMRPLIEKFSKLGLLFYAETLSGGRDLSNLKTEKKLIELFDAGFFDGVVRIGHTPLTKIWRLLEKKPLPVFHFDSRNLPGLSFGEVLPMDSEALLKNDQFWNALDKLSPFPIGDETVWTLEKLIQKYPESEVATLKKLQGHLNTNDQVYLGNSLVIRFFELTQTAPLQVFGNRGVNGIDGQLASAIGLAMGTSNPVYCILGDVTTFYDLSSLREMPENLHLIIMNNKGGRIFDMLKLDKRIVLEHENDFENICKGLHLSYSNNLKDFGLVKVLELSPSREQSENFLREWR